MRVLNKNITFVPLTEKDLEWARELHNDPDVLVMLTDPRPVSKDAQIIWYEKLKQSITSIRWVVRDINKSNIGVVRLDSIDYQNNSICIGLDIHKDFRRKGYARTIYERLIPYLFNDMGFNRIWLLVADYNIPAINLYTSLGFKQEGTQYQALYRNTKYSNYIMMSLLKEEYHV